MTGVHANATVRRCYFPPHYKVRKIEVDLDNEGMQWRSVNGQSQHPPRPDYCS